MGYSPWVAKIQSRIRLSNWAHRRTFSTPLNLTRMVCGLPWWLSGKESTCQCRTCGLMPLSGSFPVEGNGNPLQFSCLENPMNRGAWQAAIHGVAKKSDVTYRLKQQKLMTENLAEEFVSLESQKLLVLPTWKETWRKHLLQWEEQIYCSVETMMMLWKCCTQYASKFGKLSSGHRTGKGQFSFQSQRKAVPKND